MNFIFRQKNSGFTVIEVIVAVFVIAIGLVAIINLVSRTLSNSLSTRDTIVAASLAQEGVELIRNIRDNNLASGNAPFVRLPANNSSDCIRSFNETGSVNCSATNFELHYSDGFFDHTSSGAITKFKRKITFVYDSGNRDTANNVEIQSILVWGDVWPAANLSDCNTANRCAFTQATLKKR